MFIVLMDFDVYSLDGLYYLQSRWTSIRSVYNTSFKSGFNHRSGSYLMLEIFNTIHDLFVCPFHNWWYVLCQTSGSATLFVLQLTLGNTIAQLRSDSDLRFCRALKTLNCVLVFEKDVALNIQISSWLNSACVWRCNIQHRIQFNMKSVPQLVVRFVLCIAWSTLFDLTRPCS